ncbi:hypothetical protein ABPG72_020757 [Tetrahymena utriculariae]
MQQRNITYQGLEGIYNQQQNDQQNLLSAPQDMKNAFLMVSQHIVNSNSQITNSMLTQLFDDIQKKMEQDHEIQKKTTDNIKLVQENKVYPPIKKQKPKIIDGLTNLSTNQEAWNKDLAAFLRVLRQYLKDNECELKFIVNESNNEIEEGYFGAWRLLTLNDTTNLKYCATFKNYKLTYTQLLENKKEITYLCDLVQWAVSVVLENVDKQKVKILNIVQSPNSQSDIEVHFILDESDIEHSKKEINFDALSKELMNTIKQDCCQNITACKKKVTKIVTLTYSYFLKEYSRNWDNLKKKVDKRGIKNGEKQDYFFPFTWYGFANDVSSIDNNDENWLSMDEKNPRAWAVAYLPATLIPLSSEDRFQYSQSSDKFTNSQIGSSITIYRKPEEMEQKCHIITDPQTNKKYKIGYLCRVNINTLKCPQNNPNIYLISNLNEVRPYRILIKEVK